MFANRSGINAKILFRIKVDHAIASGRGASTVAMTNKTVLSLFASVLTRIWIEKLEGFLPIAKMVDVSFWQHLL